ncbi:MAG: type II secretion system F family protein [Saccharofermentanales bacterium]
MFFIIATLLVVFWSGKSRIDKRLSNLTAESGLNEEGAGKKERREDDKGFLKGFSKGKALKKLSDELSLAAIPLRAEEFLLLWLLAALAPAGLVSLVRFNVFVCAALISGGTAIVPALLNRAKKKRITMFDKQLSDALSIIGNSIRAGFTFQQAMESISKEMPDPISKEFSRTLREIKLGVTMERALGNMIERLDNGDLELIVSAVLIQRQVGGNLAEILDTISQTIKERIKIKNEIRVLTASARTSGMIIGLLPVFILGILMLINPDYVSVFFTTSQGIAMLAGSAILELTGFMLIKKVVSIKF